MILKYQIAFKLRPYGKEKNLFQIQQHATFNGQLENPLETDPIVVHIIDPPPFGFLAENEKQAEVIKNRFSLLSIYVFPFS